MASISFSVNFETNLGLIYRFLIYTTTSFHSKIIFTIKLYLKSLNNFHIVKYTDQSKKAE